MPRTLIEPYTARVTKIQNQESIVKRWIMSVGIVLSLLVGVSLAQESAKQDMKDAGHETKQAAKDAGHATKTTAKKAGHKTKKGVHKGAKKVEEKTQ